MQTSTVLNFKSLFKELSDFFQNDHSPELICAKWSVNKYKILRKPIAALYIAPAKHANKMILKAQQVTDMCQCKSTAFPSHRSVRYKNTWEPGFICAAMQPTGRENVLQPLCQKFARLFFAAARHETNRRHSRRTRWCMDKKDRTCFALQWRQCETQLEGRTILMCPYREYLRKARFSFGRTENDENDSALGDMYIW